MFGIFIFPYLVVCAVNMLSGSQWVIAVTVSQSLQWRLQMCFFFFFCPTNSPKPEDIQFDVAKEREKQQISRKCPAFLLDKWLHYQNSCRLFFCWAGNSLILSSFQAAQRGWWHQHKSSNDKIWSLSTSCLSKLAVRVIFLISAGQQLCKTATNYRCRGGSHDFFDLLLIYWCGKGLVKARAGSRL